MFPAIHLELHLVNLPVAPQLMMRSPTSIPFRRLLSRPFPVPIDAINLNELYRSLHLDKTGHKTRHTNSVERSSIIRYEEKFVVRTVALLQFLE